MIVVPKTLVRPTPYLGFKSGLHVSEQIDCICIVIDRCIADDSQGMQLVAKSSFTDNKLSGVSSVETVDTVGPCDSVLHA